MTGCIIAVGIFDVIITILKYYAPDHEHQGTIHINKGRADIIMLCPGVDTHASLVAGG